MNNRQAECDSYSCDSLFLTAPFFLIYYITIYILISYVVFRKGLGTLFLIVTTVTVTAPTLVQPHSILFYKAIRSAARTNKTNLLEKEPSGAAYIHELIIIYTDVSEVKMEVKMAPPAPEAFAEEVNSLSLFEVKMDNTNNDACIQNYCPAQSALLPASLLA